MNRLVERFAQNTGIPGVQAWLVPIGLISLLSLLLQSIQYRRSNLSVFLFDYEHGFIRRGLLGAIVNLSPLEIDPYYVYLAFYGVICVLLFFLFVILFRRTPIWRDGERSLASLLFCLAILASPIFVKNAYHDFGRVDQLGYLCLLLVALAKPAAQRALIILLPPLLVLCHEGQIILAVPPMLAVFLIAALRDGSVFHLRTLVPLAASIILAMGLTVHFLLNGIPGIDHEVLSAYFSSKSPHNTGERSWLLYDTVAANFEIAMGKNREGRQLAASPLYVLAILLHLPVIGFLYRIFKDSQDVMLRLACGLVFLTVLAQCVIFFLSIDYARHISNIFVSYVVMMFFLVQRFDLGDALSEHAARYRSLLIALVLIFLPIPKFGIVAP